MTPHEATNEQGFTLVELLVTMLILTSVAGGITSVIVSSLRNQTFQEQMTQAQDEARIVFERVRQELREARRVEVSDPDEFRFWVDSNFDGLKQPDELVTYEIRPVAGSGRFEVARYTAATGASNAATLASVLRNDTPFSYDTPAPNSSVVTMDFSYDVNTVQGPQDLEVSTTIRLRNVG